MKLDSIRIVLVATSHPGNIGSTARAMKTMGLNRLYLVSPKLFPDVRASEMAAGADDILEQCVITNTLDEALAGCELVLATSARARHLAIPGLSPKEAALQASAQTDNTEIAFVFGREHAGLTNEELMCAHFHITIAANPDYSSLNLSQAVQIIAYELRCCYLSEHTSETESERITGNLPCYATVDAVQNFYTHLAEVLQRIGFLKTSNPMALTRLKRLFNRAKLEAVEVNMLRGILTQIDKSISPVDSEQQ